MTARRLSLAWLLRPFSKVRAGEGLQALLLLGCLFLILTGYYLLKTAREGMILTSSTLGVGAAQLKSYAAGAMAILLVVLVPAYGALAERVRRILLVNVSYLVVLGSLTGFIFAEKAGFDISLVFFVWVGIVSVFLVAQFWSFANDLYTEEQGNRLFAIIAIGGSLGAVLGPKLAGLVSTYSLLPFAGVFFIATIIVFNAIEHLRSRTEPHDVAAHQPIDGPAGFQLLVQHRYLLLLAAVVMAAELVKTNGEFVLSSSVTEYARGLIPGHASAAVEAQRREVIKSFYGDFFFWANLVGFLLQAFAVSRLVEKIGVRRALFVMPMIALGTYGLIGAFSAIALVTTAKLAENSTEYSVHGTVRQMLFLPTDRSVKYKAKAAIDTFLVRGADTVSAVCVWGATQMGFSGRGFAIVNMAFVGLWLAATWQLARAHRVLDPDAEGEPAQSRTSPITRQVCEAGARAT